MTSFVEGLVPFLKGKKVEVYTGGNSKDREYMDFTVSYKEVVRGKFVDAVGDVLIIEIQDGAGNTNNIFLNTWCVTAVIEPKNRISMFDAYCDEAEKQVK